MTNTGHSRDQHTHPKSNIAIAQAAKMKPIVDVAFDKLGIEAENLEPYGHYKAKLTLDYIETLKNRPDGKLILVSSVTPTPAGEGKTTTSVGLGDALNRIGKKAVKDLRTTGTRIVRTLQKAKESETTHDIKHQAKRVVGIGRSRTKKSARQVRRNLASGLQRVGEELQKLGKNLNK